MTKILLTDYVNIDVCPSSVVHADTTDLSIGDLHSNPIKLLFFLVHNGICSLSAEHYARLVVIYKTPDLTHELLAEFNALVAGMAIINHSTLIRLIGDELADRGNNDYFMLKILQKLVQGGAKIEVLLSNHGAEFIEAYERYHERGCVFQITRLDPLRHAPSLMSLAHLIDQQLVSPNEVLDIVERVYKPSLKVISYSLAPLGDGITIYSHAGIGLQSIRALAQLFDVEYNEATSLELATTIELINRQFSHVVLHNNVHALYSSAEMRQGYQGTIQFSMDNALEFIMWNRAYNSLERPETIHGYPIDFVHGHDKERSHNHIYGLDSNIGKSPYQHTDEYICLASDEIQRPCYSSEEKLSQLLIMLSIKIHHPTASDQPKTLEAAFHLLRTLLVTKEMYYLEQTDKTYRLFKSDVARFISMASNELGLYREWQLITEAISMVVEEFGERHAPRISIGSPKNNPSRFFSTSSDEQSNAGDVLVGNTTPVAMP